jgi:hypothetical protein
MTFTITPAEFQFLLNSLVTGMPKKKRASFQIVLSIGRKQISLIGNGMSSSKSMPVHGQGQCQLSWKRITDVLSTFPAEEPICFECNRKGLKINNFLMLVEYYEPKAIPKKADLPPEEVVPSPRKPIAASETPPACSPDGFSLIPPSRDEDDCTGRGGMVLPEDTQGEREPFVCPVCGRVGYFEKRKCNDLIYFRRYRTWVAADDAPNFVIIHGGERRCLCPRCVKERASGIPAAQPIPNHQTDLFENPEL